jgi:hypothetical protein
MHELHWYTLGRASTDDFDVIEGGNQDLLRWRPESGAFFYSNFNICGPRTCRER